MEIKDIQKATTNNNKIILLSKLVNELSEKTTLSDDIYLGTYNNNALYISINEPNIYYKYLGYNININKNDNGNVFISNEGLNNLKFLIIRINNYNKKENKFFNQLKEIL